MHGTRREFLKGTAAAGFAAAASIGLADEQPQTGAGEPAPGPFQTPQSERKGDMLYRTLGRTGEKVSLIGIGGSHVGQPKDEQETIKIIRTGIDRGITFMDNSWDYKDGQCEIRMGKALKDGYRGKVFLMTKADGRTKEAASKQLDESLQRLQTDHLDLWQFHEVIRMEDPDRIFVKGGAIEAAQEAKKAGKIRYIGFTGHKDPLVHLRMLQVAEANGFRFDTVQMPLNVMDYHFRSFAHQVLPVLVREQIGVLGMKSMGSKVILGSGVVQPIECLHYAMTLPTSVVITGIDSMPILDQAVEAVRTFKPLTLEQLGSLAERTKNAAETGKFELFKTTNHFDATAQHPQWLG